MNEIKYGLIFDMDGIIADTENINARASIQVFSELFNLPGVKKDDFEAGIGRGAEAYMRAAGMANDFDIPEKDIERVIEARQANIISLLSSEPLPAFPGVLELMNAALSSPDWLVAVATSSTQENTDAVLKSAKIPYRKMVVITGSEMHEPKPAPDVFLKAAARLGVSPARCVVIEDSVSGIRAAKAAGSKCIAVTNSFKASRLSEADLIVDSLTQVTLETLRLLCPK